MGKYHFITAEYANNENTLTVYARNENGEKKVFNVGGFRPYFYVPADARVHAFEGIRDTEVGFKSLYDEPLKKLIMENPKALKEFKHKFNKTYEADVRYTKRFLIDMNMYSGFELPDDKDVKEKVFYRALKPINFPGKPTICYLDIEVECEKGTRFPTSDKNPIIAISLYDGKSEYITVIVDKRKDHEVVKRENHFVMFVPDEVSLIEFLLKYFETISPDVITGWNVKDFDIKYIQDRCEINKIHYKAKGSLVFDMLEAYKMLAKRGSNRLKDVVIAEGITDQVIASEYDPDMYLHDMEKFIEYSKHDVEYVARINEKLGILDYYWQMKNFAGIEDLDTCLHQGSIVDMLVLRTYHEHGMVCPSKPEYKSWDKREEDEDGYEGAIVFIPPKGVIENVATFDMSRYYPSILIAYNLSPEGKGIIPEICNILIEERIKLDKQLKELIPGTEAYKIVEDRRNSVKFCLNAVYGYLGSVNSRIYKKEIAAKVTEVGRNGLLYLKKCAEEKGYLVVYGDTDSVMMCVPDDPWAMEKYLNEKLIEYCRKEGVQEVLQLKFEKFMKKVLFLGVKKRYAGWITLFGKKNLQETNEDYIHITGFDTKRRDTSKITKDVQTKTFELVLKGNYKDELIPYLKDKVQTIISSQTPLVDICIPKTISKPLSDYKSKQDYIRGCEYANRYMKADIVSGDTVKMMYVKMIPNLPQTDVICFRDEDNLPAGIVIDYDKMVERTIKMKVEDILEVIGMDWNMVQPGGRVSMLPGKNLGSIFGKKPEPAQEAK